MKQVKTNKEVLPIESSLQHIVQSILSNYQGMADAQNSFFVNQVPPTLCLTADKSVVSSLLSNLFSVIVNYCKNTRIKISAKNTATQHLRAEHFDAGMSTLEAIAQALGIIEGAEAKDALLKLYQLKLSRTLKGRGK